MVSWVRWAIFRATSPVIYFYKAFRSTTDTHYTREIRGIREQLSGGPKTYLNTAQAGIALVYELIINKIINYEDICSRA